MGQVVQILGALLILVAYVLAQFRVLDQHSHSYLLPNFVGSAVLTVDAWFEHQWGFVLLEGVWAIISLWSIVAKMRGRRPSAAH